MRIKNSRLFPTVLAFGKRAPNEPFLSIVLKATFRLEPSTRPAEVAPTQLPIFGADTPYDAQKPGGLLEFESDRVPWKPRADIILVGSAYAAQGHETREMEVEIRVGRTRKRLRVVGDRLWSFPAINDPPVIVGPAPFTKMPLRYDRAFGGIDPHGQIARETPGERPWCAANFEGRGFVAQRTVECLHKRPLPNIEDPADPVRAWNSRPRPAGCGFFPRNSLPRSGYLGTRDEKWKAERAPELPLDFRFDFFNGAHPDLQVEGYLRGNEPVLLRGVTERAPVVECWLPGIQPMLTVRTEPADALAATAARKTETHRIVLALDTLVFVPDKALFYQVWRGVLPSRKEDASDVEEVRIDYEDLPVYDPLEDANRRRS